jgi:pimeloyl-ACP methyl ester carboxylesterase
LEASTTRDIIMSRPVFVCVPGASHSHHIYEPLRAALAYHGYNAYPLALPSVGGNPPTYDFTEDVRAIRNLCAELADAGQEVILVMHAYGGLPGGEALWGLGRTERAQSGLRGGVIRLVFIMSCKFEGSMFSFSSFGNMKGNDCGFKSRCEARSCLPTARFSWGKKP